MAKTPAKTTGKTTTTKTTPAVKNSKPAANNKTAKTAAPEADEKPYHGLNVYSVVEKKRVDLDPESATLKKTAKGSYMLQGVSAESGKKAAGTISRATAERLVEDGYFTEDQL